MDSVYRTIGMLSNHFRINLLWCSSYKKAASRIVEIHSFTYQRGSKPCPVTCRVYSPYFCYAPGAGIEPADLLIQSQTGNASIPTRNMNSFSQVQVYLLPKSPDNNLRWIINTKVIHELLEILCIRRSNIFRVNSTCYVCTHPLAHQFLRTVIRVHNNL